MFNIGCYDISQIQQTLKIINKYTLFSVETYKDYELLNEYNDVC